MHIDAPADEPVPPPPPRPRSPIPAGDPRELGGFVQSRAMSAMEAALLEVGGDPDGTVTSSVRMWLDKTNEMKASAAADCPTTPVRRPDAAPPERAPTDLCGGPASTPRPPSPGGPNRSSYRRSIKLTVKQYREMPIENTKEDNKTDTHIPS
jgi:hypothetical protein